MQSQERQQQESPPTPPPPAGIRAICPNIKSNIRHLHISNKYIGDNDPFRDAMRLNGLEHLVFKHTMLHTSSIKVAKGLRIFPDLGEICCSNASPTMLLQTRLAGLPYFPANWNACAALVCQCQSNMPVDRTNPNLLQRQQNVSV